MKFHFHKNSVKEAPDRPLTYEEGLLRDLEQIKCDLQDAYTGFDYVTDPDLIDCYIYELNSILKRYKYILSQVNSLRPADLETELKLSLPEAPALPVKPELPPLLISLSDRVRRLVQPIA